MTPVSNLSWRIAVWSTRIGIARINRCGIWRRWPDTLDECIALIAGQARADRRMVSHVALSVSATNSGTRIIALEITACLVQRAIAVDNTLWLALNVRVSLKTRQTRTGRRLVSFIAHSVGATRRRVARINDLWPPSGG